ncbi:MAG TPA: hypothetical protein VE174_05695 [Actinomycetota bacterium]|nr:hypothetical protein [Actinomycetota bacterium]
MRLMSRKTLRYIGLVVCGIAVLAGCLPGRKGKADAPPSSESVNVSLPKQTDPLTGEEPTGGGGGGGSTRLDHGFITFNSDRADSGGDILVMDADGSNTVNLSETTESGETRPDFRHDAEKIVYRDLSPGGHWDIYQMDIDGDNPEPLTGDFAVVEDPTYSPDATQLAFVWQDGEAGPERILIGDLDEAPFEDEEDATEIPSTGNAYGPTWSPDGTKIAFYGETASEDGTDFELYVYDVGTEDLTQLTDNDCDDVNPAWGPEGTDFENQIAYSTENVPDAGCEDFEVVRRDATPGSTVTTLTENSDVRDDDPTWSPDGERIAFTTDRDGDFEIYTMDSADGLQLRNRTNHNARDVEPDWVAAPEDHGGGEGSFAEESIAFERNFDIYITEANAPSDENITDTEDEYEYNPDWNHEEDLLVYEKQFYTDDFEYHYTLEILDLSTGLTDTVVGPDDGFQFVGHPTWGPDPTEPDRIAFTGIEEGDSDREIYVYEYEEEPGNLIQVTDDDDEQGYPAWAPVGSYLAYMTDEAGGDWDIRAVIVGADLGDFFLTDNDCDDVYPSFAPNEISEFFVAYATDELPGGDCTTSPLSHDIVAIDVANDDEEFRFTASTSDDTQPTWSPDGEEIAFSSNRGGDYDLFHMPIDDETQIEAVTVEPVDDRAPDWRPIAD